MSSAGDSDSATDINLQVQVILYMYKSTGHSHRNKVSNDSELCQTRSDLLVEAWYQKPQNTLSLHYSVV